MHPGRLVGPAVFKTPKGKADENEKNEDGTDPHINCISGDGDGIIGDITVIIDDHLILHLGFGIAGSHDGRSYSY